MYYFSVQDFFKFFVMQARVGSYPKYKKLQASKFKHDRLKFELDQTQVRPPKLNFEPPSKSLQRLSIPMFGQKQTIRTHAQPNSKPLSIFAYQNKTK